MKKDPSKQLTETKLAVEQHLLRQLEEMNNFKFVVTLKVTFEKNTGDKKVIKTGYFNSIAAIIINNNDINLNRKLQIGYRKALDGQFNRLIIITST